MNILLILQDYLASMSDSDSDQSLSSHDCQVKDHPSASAESRAYFKTFNEETFKAESPPSNSDMRHSSQARPLVIPDADDGYGSVENSSSGTSDSSSSSNTPEQHSPGGEAVVGVAVTKKREAFRRSTKKKAQPSVQEKLKKLCIEAEVREVEASSPTSSTSSGVSDLKSSGTSRVTFSPQPDISRCERCGKEKGVPHLIHMYDANSVCTCDVSEQTSCSPRSSTSSSHSPPSVTASNQPVTAMARLPNRTRLQSPVGETFAKKVNFRFGNSNSSSPTNVPLKADHNIDVGQGATQSPERHAHLAESRHMDARHRDWLMDQAQLSHSAATQSQCGLEPAGTSHASPVHLRHNEDEVDAAGPFCSQTSKKILTSQKAKFERDYARFMTLLEQTKRNESEKQERSEPQPCQTRRRPCSSPVQFVKSSEIYQRLEQRCRKGTVRRSVSAPQSPVKKPFLRGAWSEDNAILVRAPLPPAPAQRAVPQRDVVGDVMAGNVVTEEQLRAAHNLQGAYDKLAQLAARKHHAPPVSRLATDF